MMGKKFKAVQRGEVQLQLRISPHPVTQQLCRPEGLEHYIDFSSFMSHRQLVREDLSVRRRFPHQPPSAIIPPLSSLGRTR